MNNNDLPEEKGKLKAKRGFGAMSPEKQKEIARKGGKAAHEQGVAHQWNSEEARLAGTKGGQVRGKAKTIEGDYKDQ